MSPAGGMTPEDQELLGHLGRALNPDAGAISGAGAALAPLPGLRTAVLARNWRWVPLLAHLSRLLALVTGATVAAVAAVAVGVTLALTPPTTHHHSPAAPATIPGSSELTPGQAGGGSSSGSKPGSGSGAGTTPGHDGRPAAALPAGAIGQGVTVVNPGEQSSVLNQPIASLSNKAENGVSPYIWSAVGLPSGLTIDSHDGTITGTPVATCNCSVTVKVTDADHHQGSTTFAWTVGGPPAITSAPSATFTVGEAGSVTVTSSGVPAPSLSELGGLPGGIKFSDQSNGTATLSGTPVEGSAGTYPITLEASNGTGSDATQTFTLTVNDEVTASLLLSPPTATIPVGASRTYIVTGRGTTGISTGDVTALTTFTITPSGVGSSAAGASCAGDSCTAAVPGTYVVTGTEGTAKGTTSLTVYSPPWSLSSGVPQIAAEGPNGFYIGATGNSWALVVTHPGSAKVVYSGTITIAGGDFSGVTPFRLESTDGLSSTGPNNITFRFTNLGRLDGVLFTTPPGATSITFTLNIGTPGTPASVSEIYLGIGKAHPPTRSPLTFVR